MTTPTIGPAPAAGATPATAPRPAATHFADTYGYCLMQNHFHFLIRTSAEEELGEALTSDELSGPQLDPGRQFGRLLNSHAKAFSRRCHRAGSLFEHPFHRIEITDRSRLLCLVAYIHPNPEQDGFACDSRTWRHSSYSELTSQKRTPVSRESLLNCSGGGEGRGSATCVP
jgi:putative transposase